MTLLHYFFDFLKARAEIQKYFRSLFGANENFKICFRDLLIFMKGKFDMYLFTVTVCEQVNLYIVNTP